MEEIKAQNCWEFWGCKSEIREKCYAYEKRYAEEIEKILEELTPDEIPLSLLQVVFLEGHIVFIHRVEYVKSCLQCLCIRFVTEQELFLHQGDHRVFQIPTSA